MDFDQIYDEYFDRIYYKILSSVKNAEDAEDITQEVFVSVYKNLSKFRADSKIYTWIYRIAINKTYDFFRKKKIDLELNEEILNIEDGTDLNSPMIIQENLKKLSKEEREILLLKDVYGYKLREISELKGRNISTIKSIYYKALKNLEEE
ncbi:MULTISPECIES: RNA polymerase sigma factor [Fusobacterium]|uniref:RNA polymerase sigma factor n=1 Tax=Fusobacterium TaxID=848 RepID=UPI000487E409|nr:MULTISPECIES: RNA polymerase sigma factor [Fusobacterium]MCI6151836.1 RNA polymerase sigma factor [Fusobacterium perfoetens]MDY3236803.1 RNA polymerase sigma factor [Fusobacterium perfoetens]NME35436.1 RNA polymerase sigma factor [Fusobacterium sp. FSA-380-WT-3A]